MSAWLDSTKGHSAVKSASGVLISLLNVALGALASWLVDFAQPMSQSHKARALMEKTFLLYAGNTA